MLLMLPLAIGGGQEQVPVSTSTVLDIAAQADSLYFASDPARALVLCEGAFGAALDDAGLRWRAARAAIAMGMLRPDRAERRALYDAALRHARHALELAPDDRDASYWLAAAAGRRAHRDDPVYSARLGREAHERVTVILAQDSAHSGAHHVLGMLHAEILRVPGWMRFVAGRVLRVDLAKRANWRSAEHHLRRAVELEPQMVLYLADLGDLHARAGNSAEVQLLAARLATAPSRHPMDDSIRAARFAKWGYVPAASQ